MIKSLYASTMMLSLIAVPAQAQVPTPAPLHQGNDDSLWTDVIIVQGHRPKTHSETFSIRAENAPLLSADVAVLAAQVPGGSVNNNGALSGQIQYRGLFGPRLAVSIDGQKFASGGPNLMDPPLHYAPRPLIARLEFSRGIAPVSKGEGLGGAVNAVLKKADFSNSPALTPQTDIMTGYRSVNNALSVGGLAALGNQHSVIEALASYEHGGNIRFPGGRIAASRHERRTLGAGFALRNTHNDRLSVHYRHQNTSRTGNPPFPMDIRFFHTDLAQAKAHTTIGKADLDFHAGYAFVEHAMNNFLLPPPPPLAGKFREAQAKAQTYSWGGALLIPLENAGTLQAGWDGSRRRHSVRIINPKNPAFLVQSFNGFTEKRLGFYGQWSADITPKWMLEAGVRTDRIGSNSGPAAISAILPPPVQSLATQFNALDHRRVDHNTDLVMRTSYAVNDRVTVRFGAARKYRTPSYLERYGWLPLPASAGLADGNIYIGDLALKPERARVFNLGVDIRTRRAYFRPALYTKTIKNFIQGVPFDATPGLIDSLQEMVANANGDPTPLRFANVRARLYGVDADFGAHIFGPWRVDGVFTAVRGKRRDIKDNLYRITPPRLSTTLSYEKADWSLGMQGLAVAAQNHIAQTNDEQSTPGYIVFNLLGRWQINDRLSASGGVENLLDHFYRQHLAGYNRVAHSAVAVGQRLPGAGRGFYLRLAFKS